MATLYENMRIFARLCQILYCNTFFDVLKVNKSI